MKLWWNFISMRETTCNSYKTHFIKSFDKYTGLNVRGHKEVVCWLPHQPCKGSSSFASAEGQFGVLGTLGENHPQAPTATTCMAVLRNSTVIPGAIKYPLYPMSLIWLHSIVLGIPRTYSCNKFVQTFFSFEIIFRIPLNSEK